jgi:2-keto-4-pentenoate hydratase
MHVLQATAAICAGLDLPIGPTWPSPPTVHDLVANNASAGSFVLGEPRLDWTGLDLSLLGVLLEIDGDVVASGAGARVLGHPARAIAQVVNQLAIDDASDLRAGEYIFTGGLTEPVTLQPGMTVEASFAHLGRVGLTVA